MNEVPQANRGYTAPKQSISKQLDEEISRRAKEYKAYDEAH